RLIRSRPAKPQDNGGHERMHRDMTELELTPAQVTWRQSHEEPVRRQTGPISRTLSHLNCIVISSLRNSTQGPAHVRGWSSARLYGGWVQPGTATEPSV